MSIKIVTFPSVHHALKAERLLKKKDIEIRVINTPRHVSSDCGICLRFDDENEKQVVGSFQEGHVEYAGIYELDELQ